MNDEDVKALRRALRVQRAMRSLDFIEQVITEGLAWREAEAEDDGGDAAPKGLAGDELLCVKLRLEPTDHLILPFEVKSADESPYGLGQVEGYLAAFENVDLGKDIIHRGAFSRTIAEAKSFAQAHGSQALYPLLWQHDQKEPIGAITDCAEDARGLRIAATVNTGIERGKQAYDGLRRGYMSFSIGYKPVKHRWVGKTRHLDEIALGEGSAVTFPMNPEARATGVR